VCIAAMVAIVVVLEFRDRRGERGLLFGVTSGEGKYAGWVTATAPRKQQERKGRSGSRRSKRSRLKINTIKRDLFEYAL
jgi:hypothetical protein